MTPQHLRLGLQIGGAISLIIGIGHVGFYRIFQWQRDFRKITPLNARILITIHIATTLLLIGFGVITLLNVEALSMSAGLPFSICLALSLFWCWRLVWQIHYFRPSRIEHDNRLLALHSILIILFLVLAIAYGAPVVSRISSGI